MNSLRPLDKVNILGAGGHCRSVIGLLKSCGFAVDGIYDISFLEGNMETILGIPLRGTVPAGDLKVILAIGDNTKRREQFENLHNRVYLSSLIHPSAEVLPDTFLGEANLVFPQCCINNAVRIGNNNILNTASVIEHECILGDHNHISVGALLCGRVKIGSRCFIGAGAVVIDGITIGDDVIVGAGAVVINDLEDHGTYVGNPARKIK